MLIQDLRHTFRGWRRTPVLALTAIATLSLGVGANAAVFSVVNAVLFRPLPYPAPERLIELFEVDPRTTGNTTRVSALNYLSWSARTKTFEAIATFQGNDFNVTDGAEVERIPGSSVTASLFRVLGVAPVAGRELRAADETPGSPLVALVAESLWRRRYSSDPAIVGKTISLNGERHEIIGVVPDTFRDVGRSQISSVAGAQLFVPLRIDPARENRGNHTLRVVGRLRRDVSLAQARAEMSAIATAMGGEFPSSNKGWGINLRRVDDSMFDEGVRSSLLALLGAVAVVMLIACANVSNLMLVKAIGRQRELALRTALGADRRRLVHQLLTESLVLALVCSVIGVGASFVTVEALRPLLPQTLPRITEIRVDLAVVAFGLLMSIGSGVFFGILPALRVRHVDPLSALMQGGRGVAGSSRSVLRQGLVATQVALATMLLVGGALLLQSFVRLHRVPLGFEPAGVLTARIGLPRSAYPDGPRTSLFYQQLIQSLDNDPDVESAAVATSAPFAPGVRAGAMVGNRAVAAATQSVVEHIVSEDYFRTLVIPIVAGRVFDDRDRAGSPTVVIVSQATARQLWRDMNPIGQQLERDGRMYEVVGVAGDVLGGDDRGARGGGLDRRPRAAMYLSATQFPQRTMTVLLRTTREPSALVPRLRAALRESDPTIPMQQARTLDEWLVDTAANVRLTTTLAGAFAAIGVLLAGIGIYGVVAYSVGQRTPEIGLRMAVGATTRHVLALVLRTGLVSVAIGTALGLGGAFVLSQVMGALLFEVRPDDPLTFASAALLLAAVSLIACYVPARRAVRVDPLVALRSE
jgi:putative ABC transport system permease protein